MKRILFAVWLAAVMPAFAQTNTAVDFAPDLARVTADLKQKFDAPPPVDFEENLSAINALIVAHLKNGNREQVARLYLLDAHIYADGLTNTTRARAIWSKVMHDFPGTRAAQGALLSLTKLNAATAAEDAKVPEGLAVGQRFPDFSKTDLAGNPLSVTAYRGRVTLVDFWATWCGPCRAEMTNVIATYRQYHAQGFDILGVSLDQERDKVAAFTQASGMSWAQYFDGLGWDNQLAKQYGVESIPMDYLLDRHGVIIGKELRGQELMAAVAKALTSN